MIKSIKMIVKMLTHIHMMVYTCGVGTFTKEVVFAGLRWVWVDSALLGKWNAYFLLRRMQILGGWHIGARVERIEVRTELMPASVQ